MISTAVRIGALLPSRAAEASAVAKGLLSGRRLRWLIHDENCAASSSLAAALSAITSVKCWRCCGAPSRMPVRRNAAHWPTATLQRRRTGCAGHGFDGDAGAGGVAGLASHLGTLDPYSRKRTARRCAGGWVGCSPMSSVTPARVDVQSNRFAAGLYRLAIASRLAVPRPAGRAGSATSEFFRRACASFVSTTV